MKLSVRASLAQTSIVLSLLVPASLIYADDTIPVHPANAVKESDINAQIRLKLSANSATPVVHIVVKTSAEGVVSLSGTAASQAEIDRAVELTRNTVGVNSVNNQIVIKPN